MTEAEIIKSVKNLNTDKNSKLWDKNTSGKAPHKPFLLLSILDGIEVGWIADSYIELNQKLIEIFFRYWNEIMEEDRKTTIALPFFHMKSEPFWELIYKEGMKPYKYSPSLGGLTKRLAYAKIDDDFYKMIQDGEGGKRLFLLFYRNIFLKIFRMVCKK